MSAKQKSYINIEGTLGELTFYERNGKHLVRRRGSLDKERILNDKQFARTRENMNEFKGASNISKQLRYSLSKLNKLLGGGTIHARLTGLIRKMTNDTDGKRGRRPFLMGDHKDYFHGFEFNEEKDFTTVFSAFYDPPAIDTNRNEVQWIVPPFDMETELEVPEGVTHYKFVMATVVLPDFVYNDDRDLYQAVDMELLNLRSVAYSDLLDFDTPLDAAIPMTTDLGLSEALPDTAISITVAGVLFYQQTSDGQLYALKGEKALRVLLVA